MTVLFNDPADFAEEQLDGFTDLYADRLQRVVGGVIGPRQESPQVAVVIGGGSGHYPAFSGLVGPGLATGAVVGNIFTSPSAAYAYSVAKAADQGRGVIFSFGNYAGDVMNFGIAAERLRKEGIDARILLVTDDVASGDTVDVRRGIAGDFAVFKCLGAAAASGMDIEEVYRLGAHANARTRSFGIAFSGCTMPGAQEPLFTVPAGQMSLGLGIHGEPGIEDAPMQSASAIADILVDKVLADAPEGAGKRVAAIVNGLGTTKYEELFVLWKHISQRLTGAGYRIDEAEVGELVTSLDMGGCSLTLLWLDDELETLWGAPAYTPAYRKVPSVLEAYRPVVQGSEGQEEQIGENASEASRQLGVQIETALNAARDAIAAKEQYLGQIDAVAGDGDHGRGMTRGLNAACAALSGVNGARAVLTNAGRAWAMQAGGTSGVLWGAALEAAGESLGDEATEYSPQDASRAVEAFVNAIVELGGARLQDKTIVDAAIPFKESLDEALQSGNSLERAWATATERAQSAAEATAVLVPQKGRARPLAARSVGTPDPGAQSFAMIVAAVAPLMASRN